MSLTFNVWRGESGEEILQSNLSSLSFSDTREVAECYARWPGGTPAGTVVEYPRLLQASIAYKKPLIITNRESMIDYDAVVKIAGLEVANQIFITLNDRIVGLSCWTEGVGGSWMSVADLLEDRPDTASLLCADLCWIADSDVCVKLLQSVGVDGMAFGVYGQATNSWTVEHRVFSRDQVVVIQNIDLDKTGNSKNDAIRNLLKMSYMPEFFIELLQATCDTANEKIPTTHRLPADESLGIVGLDHFEAGEKYGEPSWSVNTGDQELVDLVAFPGGWKFETISDDSWHDGADDREPGSPMRTTFGAWREDVTGQADAEVISFAEQIQRNFMVGMLKYSTSYAFHWKPGSNLTVFSRGSPMCDGQDAMLVLHRDVLLSDKPRRDVSETTQ